MSVTYLNYQAGNIPRTGSVPSSGFDIATITVYNNTPAQIAIYQYQPQVPATGLPGGGILIPAFYPQTVPVVGWRSFYFVTDGTAMFPLSSLVIQAQDSQAPTLPLSPFGTSAWGAGPDPTSLTQINAGNQVLAWQVRQFYNLITGAMPGNYNALGIVHGNPFYAWETAAGQKWAIFADYNTGTLHVQDATHGLTGVLVLSPSTQAAVFGGTLAAQGGALSVTGSRGGNAALASLLTQLATIGLIIDNTTP